MGDVLKLDALSYLGLFVNCDSLTEGGGLPTFDACSHIGLLAYRDSLTEDGGLLRVDALRYIGLLYIIGSVSTKGGLSVFDARSPSWLIGLLVVARSKDLGVWRITSFVFG